MVDFEQLQKAMAQMSPEQFRGMMLELLQTQPPGQQGQPQQGPPGQPPMTAPPPGPPADTGGEQNIIDGTQPQYRPPHPTQTPGAVMRQQMMRQPGMLAGRM